jgi:hypothetical protein
VKSQAVTSDIVRSVGQVKDRARQWSLAMHIPSTIRTPLGVRSLPSNPMLRVNLTQAELRTLIRAMERDAELAEREGRIASAEHLTRRTIALREAGR